MAIFSSSTFGTLPDTYQATVEPTPFITHQNNMPKRDFHRSKAVRAPCYSFENKCFRSNFVRIPILVWCILLLLFLPNCSAYMPMIDDASLMETIPASWVMQNEARASSTSTPVPVVAVQDVLQALEYTSQLNRRLQETAYNDRNDTITEDVASSASTPRHLVRGGGGGTMRVPRLEPGGPDRTTSIFHSRANEPMLQVVLSRAMEALPATSNKDMLLTLALLYLDRACSVDTYRAAAPACPYGVPNTISRLFLSAVLIAARANGIHPDYITLKMHLGISRDECEEMMETMMLALGEPGVFVTPEEMQSFAVVWQTRFPTTTTSSAMQ